MLTEDSGATEEVAALVIDNGYVSHSASMLESVSLQL